jgi:predicted permease
VDDLTKDVELGLRLLWRRPAFTLVALLSLAFGIGLNTTMFSVVNAVLFAPVPVQDPERLVEIYTSASAELPYLTTSYPDFLDLRAGTDVFSGLACHALVRGLYRRGDDRAEIVMGEVANESYFDLIGRSPALGRGFTPEETRPGAALPVLVLSHAFWQHRLSGAPDVLGQVVELSGVRYTVVGVAPPGYSGTIPGFVVDYWAPVPMAEKLSVSGIQSESPSPGATKAERRGTRWLFVKGRLLPGRTVEEARAQVETVVARLVSENPEIDKGLRAAVLPARSVRFHPMIDGVLSPAAALLMGAVGLVLLIACANVANMMLVRAASRRREIAVRLALGASRGRVVRQLLAESLALAALGGTLGVLIAVWAGRLLSTLPVPIPLPVAFTFGLDGRVLAFALLASLATTLLFGLVPALQASRPDLVPALRGEATASRKPRAFTLRDLLVSGQLALALVLLVAGALFLRGLSAASAIPAGFASETVAVLAFNPKMNGYLQDQATALQRRVVDRLRAVPGVLRVAQVSRPPLGHDRNMEGVRIRGHHQPDDEPTAIDSTFVEPDYFAALDLRLVEGRAFTEDDDQDAPKVAIVNEAMARKYWPGRSPLGERLYTNGFDQPGTEIVGVVADYKVRELGEAPRPYLHVAWRQDRSFHTTLLVRTSGPAHPLVPALRRAVLELEQALVFTDESTLQELVRSTLGPAQAGAALLGAFGLLALTLAAIGLYGVVSYAVAQRTRELGVRVALGASVGNVVRLVVGSGMRLILLGLIVGALIAAGLTRLVSSMLFGVSTVDPLAYLGAAAVLMAVALLANLLPARRAARVDPMVALRYE